jgi:hypothetical protein
MASAQAISTNTASPMTFLRPNRSAVTPVTTTNTNAGRNWTSPDPAQQSRILCLVIDLPADRDRNDLHAE